MAKKRKFKTTRGNNTVGHHPEPEVADLVFEWREEGAGWVGRVYDRNTRKPSDRDGWGYMVVEPKGGLHGLWAWRFRWEERGPVPVGGLVGLMVPMVESPPMGWIGGEHEDPDKATANCEVCLRALWVERDRKHKEWWDALPDESEVA